MAIEAVVVIFFILLAFIIMLLLERRDLKLQISILSTVDHMKAQRERMAKLPRVLYDESGKSYRKVYLSDGSTIYSEFSEEKG